MLVASMVGRIHAIRKPVRNPAMKTTVNLLISGFCIHWASVVFAGDYEDAINSTLDKGLRQQAIERLIDSDVLKAKDAIRVAATNEEYNPGGFTTFSFVTRPLDLLLKKLSKNERENYLDQLFGNKEIPIEFAESFFKHQDMYSKLTTAEYLRIRIAIVKTQGMEECIEADVFQESPILSAYGIIFGETADMNLLKEAEPLRIQFLTLIINEVYDILKAGNPGELYLNDVITWIHRAVKNWSKEFREGSLEESILNSFLEETIRIKFQAIPVPPDETDFLGGGCDQLQKFLRSD